MKYLRFAATTALSGSLLVLTAGSAFADSVGVDTTGPNSSQQTTINDNNSVDTSTSNNISIVNYSSQSASTGNVDASDNTSVGSLGSGGASNNSSTSTVVNINNPSTGTIGGGTGTTGTGNGGATGGSGGATGGTTAPTTGSVLGASTTSGIGSGSGALLPDTGASVPVDVSALRALYHPAAAATQSVVKHTSGISTAFLVLAGLLSLAGAMGSVIVTNRRSRVI